MAGVTGLEPAASCVTGRRSNQLSYTPILVQNIKDRGINIDILQRFQLISFDLKGELYRFYKLSLFFIQLDKIL